MIRLLIAFFLFSVFNSSGRKKFRLAPRILKYNLVLCTDTVVLLMMPVTGKPASLFIDEIKVY